MARAHAHSPTVMFDALSFLPPLRRGVKLGWRACCGLASVHCKRSPADGLNLVVSEVKRGVPCGGGTQHAVRLVHAHWGRNPQHVLINHFSTNKTQFRAPDVVLEQPVV
jgi:hypothetical protein